MEQKLVVFQNKKIRRVMHNKEWWFSVVDVIEALTDSLKPRDYWYAMKIRVKNEDGVQLSTIYRRLKLKSTDSNKYFIDCANTERFFALLSQIILSENMN